MERFKQYRRKGLSEMRSYVMGEDLTNISVADVDDPQSDMGMIARNPNNHSDQLYVAEEYFNDNLELVDESDGLSFGLAIEAMKKGFHVCRAGWNGKGIFLGISHPGMHNYMTQSFIYIDTTGLATDNPDAAKCRVPWLASQTDMLADDFEVI